MARKKKINLQEINLDMMQDFQDKIEELIGQSDIRIIDAIAEYCDSIDVDVEEVLPLISDGLRVRILKQEVAVNNIKSNEIDLNPLF